MTVAAVFSPTQRNQALIYNSSLIVLGSLLIALSAKISILLPFSPVPVTAQTLAVLLVGALLGSRLGTLAVLAYLLEGVLGLPVFAAGVGPAALLGPTGGYLIGFIFAAFVVGLLSERGWDRNMSTTALAMLLGNLTIYLFGAAWLSTLIGFEGAIQAGVMPFLIGDVIKIALAALLLPAAWQLLNSNDHAGN